MARRLIRRILAGGLVSLLVAFLVGVFVAPASADPVDPCRLLLFKLKTACENTQKLVNGGGGGDGSVSTPGIIDFATDPLGSIAKSTGQGAAWLIDQIGTVVNSVTVDFTNLGWLVVYAVVFAASTILTLLLWLGGVIKRVIRGVGPAQAIGEAVGYLWLAVLASAFTPVVLAGMVIITDDVTLAIQNGTQTTLANLHVIPATATAGPGSFLAPLSTNLRAGASDSTGGAILFMFVAFITMVTAVVLWLELLMRVAMLYIGGALATAVYAGLVDKDLWGHVKRYLTMMIGIDLLKPILVVVLLVGEAISSTAPTGGIPAILAGTSILWVAAFGQAMLYRMIPVVGDDLAYGRQLRRGVTPSQLRPSITTTGAAGVSAGIGAHADRSGGGLGRVADMTVRMQPGSGSSGTPPEASRMRPEPPPRPPAPRPPSGGG